MSLFSRFRHTEDTRQEETWCAIHGHRIRTGEKRRREDSEKNERVLRIASLALLHIQCLTVLSSSGSQPSDSRHIHTEREKKCVTGNTRRRDGKSETRMAHESERKG